ncbi:MAG TPA: nucleotidyltransferase domain-containing protein [Dehalococcoidia bacterium]|jgi:predicted nucleotidyltransferase
MNEASRWRLALAHEIAALYAARPGVRMILVGGSVAAGRADDYSDLDIAVYWERVDAAWLEEPPLEALGAERFTFVPTNEHGGRLEQYFLGTLKIDVGSIDLDAWRELVDAVLLRAEIDPAKQKALSGFVGAAPLHGAAEWRLRRERIARYPQALAEAMARAHLFFYPPWVPERLALDRAELPGLYDLLCGMIRNLLALLAAVNRVYFATAPELKWTAETLAAMAKTPAATYERIAAVLATPCHETLDDFYGLIAETLTLVERELPAVETRRSRDVLALALQPTPVRPHPPERV